MIILNIVYLYCGLKGCNTKANKEEGGGEEGRKLQGNCEHTYTTRVDGALVVVKKQIQGSSCHVGVVGTRRRRTRRPAQHLPLRQ